MGGGVIQLAAYGSQNQYLNGNPQMTFFKAVYRRHTNFSMEAIRVDFEGTKDLSIDRDVQLRCKIPRSGDLMNKMYFVINLPDIYSGYEPPADPNDINDNGTDYKFWWISSIGSHIIKKASLSIGGNKINEIYGEWIEIWHEIFCDESAKAQFDNMTGNVADIFMPQYNGVAGGVYPTSTLHSDLNENPQDRTKITIFNANPFLQKPSILGRKIYVPIPFWFTTNPGLALPLIALQYHEVYLEVELRKITELYTIIETRENIDNVKKGQRRRPLGSQAHHHIGNFITSKNFNSDSTSGGSVDLNDGNQNVQGWDSDAHVLVNYIFLDTQERTKFSNDSHEYLIEQVQRKQFLGVVGEKLLNIKLEHPVKYLAWYAQRDDVVDLLNAHNNYTNWRHEFIPPGSDSHLELIGVPSQDYLYYEMNEATDEPIVDTATGEYVKLEQPLLPTKFNYKFYTDTIIQNTRLLFNGVERFSTRDDIYFKYVQPYQHNVKIDKKGVYFYSFSLDPTKYQPSGACNMSRISNIQMDVETSQVRTTPGTLGGTNDTLQHEYKYNIYLYAVNYNVLRIMSGMAGLSFAN